VNRFNSSNKNIVGFLKQEIIDLLSIELKAGDIRLFPGSVKHIKKRRLNCYKRHKNKIPEIINTPDYVGTSPKYPNSVKFIKKYNDNILVAIRLENLKGLCVVTMYDVTESKIVNMLKHNRIKELKK
jgi:hypothetical protein